MRHVNLNQIRTLTLQLPDAHSYWNSGEYVILMPNGEEYDLSKHRRSFGHSYRIEVTEEGIYYVLQYCGSGYGKKDGEKTLIIHRNEYDMIQYKGEVIQLSEQLTQEIASYTN
ncbi:MULTISPECIES: hypothetical protein [unclassified Paraflavitalea]|uniref:hypothetical protein n=1 Tax=unclassified Paraflavitalea TaxID=2798305 RepID=UPI003D3357B7